MEQTASLLKPRTKNKVRIDLGSKELYDFYLKRYGNELGLTQSQFSSIVKDFNTEIMKAVIEEAYFFMMPYVKFGLFIKSYKIKLKEDEFGNLVMRHLRIDWATTLNLWKVDQEAREKKIIVRHFNEHSGRRNYRFYFDKVRSRTKNQAFYAFIPTRKWKRHLAATIKNPDKQITYYE